jgi:hypothetical protein
MLLATGQDKRHQGNPDDSPGKQYASVPLRPPSELPVFNASIPVEHRIRPIGL